MAVAACVAIGNNKDKNKRNIIHIKTPYGYYVYLLRILLIILQIRKKTPATVIGLVPQKIVTGV